MTSITHSSLAGFEEEEKKDHDISIVCHTLSIYECFDVGRGMLLPDPALPTGMTLLVGDTAKLPLLTSGAVASALRWTFGDVFPKLEVVGAMSRECGLISSVLRGDFGDDSGDTDGDLDRVFSVEDMVGAAKPPRTSGTTGMCSGFGGGADILILGLGDFLLLTVCGDCEELGGCESFGSEDLLAASPADTRVGRLYCP